MWNNKLLTFKMKCAWRNCVVSRATAIEADLDRRRVNLGEEQSALLTNRHLLVGSIAVQKAAATEQSAARSKYDRASQAALDADQKPNESNTAAGLQEIQDTITTLNSATAELEGANNSAYDSNVRVATLRSAISNETSSMNADNNQIEADTAELSYFQASRFRSSFANLAPSNCTAETTNNVSISMRPFSGSPIVARVAAGTALAALDTGKDWNPVLMPDYSIGWVSALTVKFKR